MPKKLMKTLMLAAVSCICWFSGCSRTPLEINRPMRIVQRADNQYEVERLYGILGWSAMGGPYKSLAEAEARCKRWRVDDAATDDEDKLRRGKKTIIKKCH